ncbi:MAG: putative nucleotidyltransferase [Desulfacinum sp.]|jgi:predicted nucleotidyltransferase|nr:putative nucleotidyltransferase [Desulfacinum sp.]
MAVGKKEAGVEGKTPTGVLVRLRQVLLEREDVAAALLFGSTAQGDPSARDVDVLILPVDRDAGLDFLVELQGVLAKALNVPADRIDAVLFDPEKVHRGVLMNAVRTGVPILIRDEEAYTDALERLSAILCVEEVYRRRAKAYLKELTGV